MKTKTLLILLLIAATTFSIRAQENEEFRPFVKMELQDVVDALSLADIHIYKHDIGTFDEESTISIIVEEWKDFKMIDSQVRLSLPLGNTFFPENIKAEEEKNMNVLRAINRKHNDSLMLVQITVNDIQRVFYLKMKQLDGDNRHLPYFPVPYKNKSIETDKNIPVMLYGTMWHDKEFNVYRFCGRTYLTNEDDDADAKELLTSSPHYYIISYKIEKPAE